LLVAYDDQQPAIRAGAAAVVARAGFARIGLDVVGPLHRQEDGGEVLTRSRPKPRRATPRAGKGAGRSYG